MKIEWTRQALEQIEQAQEFIAQENPKAAKKLARNLYSATVLLKQHPSIGRTGRVSGTREWVVAGSPYLLGYLIDRNKIYILAVLHSKQAWPAEL